MKYRIKTCSNKERPYITQWKHNSFLDSWKCGKLFNIWIDHESYRKFETAKEDLPDVVRLIGSLPIPRQVLLTYSDEDLIVDKLKGTQ